MAQFVNGFTGQGTPKTAWKPGHIILFSSLPFSGGAMVEPSAFTQCSYRATPCCVPITPMSMRAAMVVPTAAADWCPWHFTARGKRRDYRDCESGCGC
jgi:hypothetical protein